MGQFEGSEGAAKVVKRNESEGTKCNLSAYSEIPMPGIRRVDVEDCALIGQGHS